MPSTLHRWVRPRSALDGSIGLNRATRQTIFEAPMSRTDRIALLRAGIWRMRGGSGRKLMAAGLSLAHGRRPIPPPPPATAAQTRAPACEDRARARRGREYATGDGDAAGSRSRPADRPPEA